MPKSNYVDRMLDSFAVMTRAQKKAMQIALSRHMTYSQREEWKTGLVLAEEMESWDWNPVPELMALIEQGLLAFKVNLGNPGRGQGLRLTEKGLAMMEAWHDSGRPGEIED